MTTGARLPASIAPGAMIGEGRRSCVFRATWEGRTVALKIYRRLYVDRHRHRLGLSIARFEHDRNKAFYDVLELRPFVAEPLLVIGEGDGMDDAFVQELIDDTVALGEVLARTGHVPPEALDAVRDIIRIASAAGLHDIDLDPDNIRLRKTAAGWLPVLFDFNMIPQHMRAPNPFVALLYRTGLRDRSYRDRRWLRRLERL
jgi:hypothetical protein